MLYSGELQTANAFFLANFCFSKQVLSFVAREAVQI